MKRMLWILSSVLTFACATARPGTYVELGDEEHEAVVASIASVLLRVRPPGTTRLRMSPDGGSPRLQDALRDRLRTAGYAIDETGGDGSGWEPFEASWFAMEPERAVTVVVVQVGSVRLSRPFAGGEPQGEWIRYE